MYIHHMYYYIILYYMMSYYSTCLLRPRPQRGQGPGRERQVVCDHGLQGQ